MHESPPPFLFEAHFDGGFPVAEKESIGDEVRDFFFCDSNFPFLEVVDFSLRRRAMMSIPSPAILHEVPRLSASAVRPGTSPPSRDRSRFFSADALLSSLFLSAKRRPFVGDQIRNLPGPAPPLQTFHSDC